jgi:hypothetical protein
MARGQPGKQPGTGVNCKICWAKPGKSCKSLRTGKFIASHSSRIKRERQLLGRNSTGESEYAKRRRLAQERGNPNRKGQWPS